MTDDVLASASPARLAVQRAAGVEPTVLVSNVPGISLPLRRRLLAGPGFGVTELWGLSPGGRTTL